jgi:hypothetical protein
MPRFIMSIHRPPPIIPAGAKENWPLRPAAASPGVAGERIKRPAWMRARRAKMLLAMRRL